MTYFEQLEQTKQDLKERCQAEKEDWYCPNSEQKCETCVFHTSIQVIERVEKALAHLNSMPILLEDENMIYSILTGEEE